ncbi:MAG TPA: hypothetical protein DHN29_18055, partial [Cytophagales bacterium]|nr:hypothetical protein [Cytophagales bacterium]
MSNLTNKDKRGIIDRIATDVMLTEDRLAHDIYYDGRDYTWVIDEYQFSVWMKAFECNSGITYEDLKIVRRCIAALANTLELPKFKKKARITTDSPIELVGRFAPRIARRADLLPVDMTKDACQAMSRFPFVLDYRCCEIFSEYRKALPYDEQEGFLPSRTLMEWGLISGTFHCLWNKLDEQCRAYANTAGTIAPMYDKVSRAVARHAEFKSVSPDDMARFEAWLQTEFKFDSGVDKWADDIIGQPQQFLNNGGKVMAIGAAFGWYDAVKTRRSNYIQYVDAPSSGLGHIYAKDKNPRTEIMVNMNAKGYEHPYSILAKALRSVDIYNLRGADLGDIVRELAKPTANPGQYGGTQMAIASKIMDLEHDGKKWLLGTDKPKTPKVPMLLEGAFEGIEDPAEICDQMVNLCKPYARAFRLCFQPITSVNKEAQAIWKAGMVSNGIPTAIVSNFGYVNQPTPFTRMKLQRPLDIVRASWYEDGKRIKN